LAEDTAERFLQSGTARLWTTSTGRGTPLLLFNGGPGCDDYLGPVAEMVEDLCHVIRFEPGGCGRSDWDGNYDVETLLADAEAVRQAYGVERMIVGGHSWGPTAALLYALKHQDVVLGIVGIAGGKIVNDREWSAAYHKGLEDVGEDLGGVEFTADPRVNPEGNEDFRSHITRPGLLREIADLPVPAVFINAGKDIRPNWPTQQLAELLPNGEYAEIAGAAHHIWLTHAVELRTELRRAVRLFSEESPRSDF
jgi:proline iminopeptidase